MRTRLSSAIRSSAAGVAAVVALAAPARAQVSFSLFETFPSSPPDGGPFGGGSVLCSGITGSSATGFSLNFNDVATRSALCPSNPDRFVPAQGDSFGGRFAGLLTVQSAGLYQLTIDADDGDQLVVNGSVVTTSWFAKASGPGLVGSINLNAGANPFILDYFQGPATQGFISLALGPGIVVSPTPDGPSVTPEPQTWALLATGLAAVAAWRRRRAA
jgi:MYXO-CTERM domain-containing protein